MSRNNETFVLSESFAIANHQIACFREWNPNQFNCDKRKERRGGQYQPQLVISKL
jgi:hypothetical protein